MASENYSIKDLEKLSGIKAHTIRIWEKRYGVIRPERTKTNIRYYSNEDLKKLLNFSLLNQHGFKISVISLMSATEIAQKISAITISDLKDSYCIEENLLLSLIDMDENRFNKAFNTMILHYGFEGAMGKVIFPFFNRIGIMWQTGAINPAQEHFFSNLIRSKIIIATEGLIQTPVVNKEVALLFLPEQELHEIALLLYNYLLRARGYKTIYLGQAVPADSLSRVIKISKPDYIVSSMTNPVNSQDFNSFSKMLSKYAPTAKIFFAGPIPADIIPHGRTKNTFLIKDLLEILKVEI
jgi:DNA-binding transcriptional MerR regulator